MAGRRGGVGGGWGQVCVCACTGINSQSAEPNVPPLKVYLGQVVLVSLEVKADRYDRTWS